MASWGRRLVVAVWLVLACNCVYAAVRVDAATLHLPGVQLADVHIDVAPAAGGRLTLRLTAAKVTVPALGWHDVELTLVGAPQRTASGAWKLVGHVATQGAPGKALHSADLTVVFDRNSGTLEVDIEQGKSGIDALLPLDQTSHVQMQLAAVPLAWLRGMLTAAWPGGRIDGGTVAGNVAVDYAASATRVSGRITVQDAGLDSKGGTIATRKLGAEGIFRIDTGAGGNDVLFDGQLHGGQLLLGPLYAHLPGRPVGLHVAGTFGRDGVAIDALDFDDPGALRLKGSVGFSAQGGLTRLDLTQFAATFPAAYQRYGTTLVEGLTGFKSLATAGAISGVLDYTDKGLHVLRVTAKNLKLHTRGGSFAVVGLDGGVDWQAGASRPATHLKWRALSLYRLAFGATRLDLKDDRGTLRLRAPASVGLFGGTFRLARFAWQPGAKAAQGLSAAFSLSGIDMNALCKALGWPAFGGKIGGAVPDLSYRDGELRFGGGMTLDVFGGSVSITSLQMRHPFGKAPVLAANINLRRLGLARLTSVFGFGKITGRLDGTIHGLRLVDWRPVAFAAKLATVGGGEISQDAIKGLTAVGGGGIAGGLQGLILGLFKTFSYARIGISCTLAHGVCKMGGITPDPNRGSPGYTIVEGSGLPRITVIGHERLVDWAALISRLKAAAGSSGPVVRH